MKILKFIKRSAMAALAATMLMGTMQPMQVLAAEDLTLEVDKIGRASCREIVCTDV